MVSATGVNKTHFGIYAIIIKDAAILLVKKSRGPYIGKLDLPGGRPEFGETPEQVVIREVLEETGINVLQLQVFDNYSVLVHYVVDGVLQSLYHTGMIYRAVSFDDSHLVHEMDAEDSLGAQWYPLALLTEEMLSPFAYRAVIAC